MEEIGKLSNDELFRLCKSSGINAGPITASTRSVYEKKLRSFLLDVTSESASKSEAPPAAKQPVVELRAIDLDVPVFAKPATPKAKPAIATAAPPAPEQVPEPVHVDKPRRSILRNNNVESRVNEPVQEPITNCEFFRSNSGASFFRLDHFWICLSRNGSTNIKKKIKYNMYVPSNLRIFSTNYIIIVKKGQI